MLNKHIEQNFFILILFVPFSEKLRQSRVFQHMNITCNRERSLTRGGARSHALLIYLDFNMFLFFLEVMSVLVLSIILMCLLLWESKFL